MPSTSVHLPDDLLARLDQVAKERHVTRNRLIVDACRSMLDEGNSDWPDDFFTKERLPKRDRDLLRSTLDDWCAEIESARRSKRRSPF